ncbi:MAG: hypothetical protein M1827_003691 [Pycnora praestabilis]|nr:MAG: hypothetical protein M1827_003691 [Pycnora praestabilis]
MSIIKDRSINTSPPQIIDPVRRGSMESQRVADGFSPVTRSLSMFETNDDALQEMPPTYNEATDFHQTTVQDQKAELRRIYEEESNAPQPPPIRTGSTTSTTDSQHRAEMARAVNSGSSSPGPCPFRTFQKTHRKSSTPKSPDTMSTISSTAAKGSILPLSIMTKDRMISSGFPYNPELFHLHVPPDAWDLFTGEIVKATETSVKQNALAITAGASIAIFGAIRVGIYVGNSVRHKHTIKNVRKGMTNEDGLAGCLQRWNEGFFANVGLTVRLEVPPEAIKREQEKHGIKVEKDDSDVKWKDKMPWKKEVKEAKRFRIVVTSTGDKGEGELEQHLGQELNLGETGVLEALGDQPQENAANSAELSSGVIVNEMERDRQQGIISPISPGSSSTRTGSTRTGSTHTDSTAVEMDHVPISPSSTERSSFSLVDQRSLPIRTTIQLPESSKAQTSDLHFPTPSPTQVTIASSEPQQAPYQLHLPSEENDAPVLHQESPPPIVERSTYRHSDLPPEWEPHQQQQEKGDLPAEWLPQPQH